MTLREETETRQLSALAAAAWGPAMAFARDADYAGADPYDGLSSPLARRLRGRRLRQVWTQAHKHGGLRLRRLSGIEPVRTVKGLSLFARSAHRMGEAALARELALRILEERGRGPWGYEFDVQTRWGFYPADSPNVVATAFALRALRDAGLLELVSPDAADWLQAQYRTGGYFAYTSDSDRLIHNGSLLAAESLAILGVGKELSAAAVATALDAQTPEGSWAYGEGPGLGWVDSVHTIYMLDSLSALNGVRSETEDAVERGSAYWREHCLSAEGLPLQVADARRPSRDVHCVSTAVGYLSRTREESLSDGTASSALRWLLSFQAADGGFRAAPGRPAHMRWNQGHAVMALSEWGDLR